MNKLLKKIFGRSIPDFRSLVESGALIVDVRTPEEFKEGNVTGSINIPLDKLYRSFTDLKDKNKPVITVCRSGTRSGMAAAALKNAGIEVYNGGGWKNLQNKLS